MSQDLGHPASVAVLQPRRDAAEGVATAVAARCNVDFPNHITCRTSEIKAGQEDATALICVQTYGVLLNAFRNDRLLTKYDAVMFDEIHEESLDMYLALGLIKEANKRRAKEIPALPKIKIILSSATLQRKKYEDYFQHGTQATVEVRGSLFPVTEKECPNDAQIPVTQNDNPEVIPRLAPCAEAAAKTVQHILRTTRTGDVLVFLPGLRSIQNAIGLISRFIDEGQVNAVTPNTKFISRFRDKRQVEVLQLHGSDPSQHRQKVLKGKQKGDTRRRVIVSTNMAETSVTVPGIAYVVDAGRKNENVFDPETGVSGLHEVPASRAEMTQRKGRAGRIATGEYYILQAQEDVDIIEQGKRTLHGETDTQKEKKQIHDTLCKKYRTPELRVDFNVIEDAEKRTTTIFWQVHRLEHPVPESLRVELSQYVLRVLSFGVKDVENFDIPDKPPIKNIEAALRLLQGLGAITEQRDLTSIGKEMASLPLEPRLARMLIAAKQADCVIPALHMAAFIQQSRSPFRPPHFLLSDETPESLMQKQQKFRASISMRPPSDWTIYHHILNQFKNAGSRQKFCNDNGLDIAVLEKAERAFVNIKKDLERGGYGDLLYNASHGIDPDTLNPVILTAFAPDHLILRGTKSAYQYAHRSSGDIFLSRGSIAQADHYSNLPPLVVALDFNKGLTKSEREADYAVGIHPVTPEDVWKALGGESGNMQKQPTGGVWDPKQQRMMTTWQYQFKKQDGSWCNIGSDRTDEFSDAALAAFAEKIVDPYSGIEEPSLFLKENREAVKKLESLHARSRGRVPMVDLKKWYKEKLGKTLSLYSLSRKPEKHFLLKIEEFCDHETLAQIEQQCPLTVDINGVTCQLQYRYQYEVLTVTIVIPQNGLQKIDESHIPKERFGENVQFLYTVVDAPYPEHSLEALKNQESRKRFDQQWGEFISKNPPVPIQVEPLDVLPDLAARGYVVTEYDRDSKGEPQYAYPAIVVVGNEYVNGHEFQIRYMPSQESAKDETEKAQRIQQERAAKKQRAIDRETLLVPAKRDWERMKPSIQEAKGLLEPQRKRTTAYDKLETLIWKIQATFMRGDEDPRAALSLMNELQVFLHRLPLIPAERELQVRRLSTELTGLEQQVSFIEYICNSSGIKDTVDAKYKNIASDYKKASKLLSDNFGDPEIIQAMIKSMRDLIEDAEKDPSFAIWNTEIAKEYVDAIKTNNIRIHIRVQNGYCYDMSGSVVTSIPVSNKNSRTVTRTRLGYCLLDESGQLPDGEYAVNWSATKFYRISLDADNNVIQVLGSIEPWSSSFSTAGVSSAHAHTDASPGFGAFGDLLKGRELKKPDSKPPTPTPPPTAVEKPKAEEMPLTQEERALYAQEIATVQALFDAAKGLCPNPKNPNTSKEKQQAAFHAQLEKMRTPLKNLLDKLGIDTTKASQIKSGLGQIKGDIEKCMKQQGQTILGSEYSPSWKADMERMLAGVDAAIADDSSAREYISEGMATQDQIRDRLQSKIREHAGAFFTGTQRSIEYLLAEVIGGL